MNVIVAWTTFSITTLSITYQLKKEQSGNNSNKPESNPWIENIQLESYFYSFDHLCKQN